MKKVDLNSDLGEGFGSFKIGMDKEILDVVTSANIACGWHAGDPVIMQKTVDLSRKKGVAVGAHPGYFDLMGFGRRNMNVTPEEVKSYVKYQVGALKAFTDFEGLKLQHVKPHGAMYNMAAKDYSLALGIAEGIKEIDSQLILLGLAGSELIKAGKEVGLTVASEVFADRAYTKDGKLVPRTTPGAVIHDKEIAIARVIRMVQEGKVQSIEGEDIDIEVHSICVHGDNPEALEFVVEIKNTLEKEGIEVTSLAQVVKTYE